MKKIVLIAFSLMVGVAFAHNCPNEIKAIDAKITSSKLSDADMLKVKSLRDEGEKLHKSGNHDGSMKALGEAKKILGI
jgi:hypothetical protein